MAGEYPKSACVPHSLAPDLVVVNGNILTVDEAFNRVQAIAVKNGVIIAVGDDNTILPLRGAQTKILDLQGKTLLPGINDSHMHLPWYVVSKPPYKLDLNYPNVRSITDIRALVKAAAAEAQPGDWIVGEGWNSACLAELRNDPQRQLHKNDLDDIAPDNPVYLIEFSFHNAWTNSKALALAGITKNTPSPAGGTIVKDPATGEPTGFVREKACNLLESVKPVITPLQLKEALLLNGRHLAALGITSITSAAESPLQVRLYSQIALRGDYSVRLNLLLLWTDYGLGGTLEDLQKAMEYVGTTTGFGNAWLRVGGVKIFADGIPPAETAWVYDAYPDGSHGSLVVPGADDEERRQHLEKMIKLCHDMGYQVGVHACGDRTVDACVAAFVAAQRANPWDARHYTIHGDWIRPATIKTMAEWGIGHTTQPVIKQFISDQMDGLVGEARSGEQWPLKSLMDAGVMMANSSDAPCNTADWRLGMAAALTRKSLSGKVSGAHQRLSISEAIRSYTTMPAWLEHSERVKGSIEVGKYADFCVIGDDITAIAPEAIPQTPILMTVVGGRVVYSDNTLTAS